MGFLVVFPTRVMYTISGVEGLTHATKTINETNLDICFCPKNYVKSIDFVNFISPKSLFC